jgi:uncharacterized protein
LSAETPPATRRGVRLFNAGRYLSAQQVWEEAWREAAEDERAFLEALVQLAGGLHLRTRRGALRGAVQLMSQALILLEDYRPEKHGVDVARLVDDFAAYAEWVKASKRPHRLLDRLRIPRIH